MAVPHWLMTAVVLPDLLRQDGVPEVLSDILAAIVGGHHGLIPSSMKVDNTPLRFTEIQSGHQYGNSYVRDIQQREDVGRSRFYRRGLGTCPVVRGS